MSENREQILEYFSELTKLGYTAEEILSSFEANKIVERKFYKTPVDESVITIGAVNKTNLLLGKQSPPRKTKFIVVGISATKRLKDKPTAYCTMYISRLINNQPEPISKVDLYGSEVALVDNIRPQTLCEGELCLKVNGGFKVAEGTVITTQETIAVDPDQYLSVLGIPKVTVKWVKEYMPETNTKGYPIKLELFCIEGQITAVNSYAIKENDTIQNSAFNIFDNSEIFRGGKDDKGFALKPGIPVYCSPNITNLLDTIGRFGVIGIVSHTKDKDKPRTTSMNGVATLLYSTPEQTIGVEER